MLEKEQTPNTLASNGQNRSDEETGPGSVISKKKRIKCIAFIVAFTLFQTAILLLFIFFVLRFKNPKFRIRYATFDAFEVGTDSFNLTMKPEFGVKNTNFGHFKYQMSNVSFEYRGTVIGFMAIDKARARARSTRKFGSTVVLTTERVSDSSELRSDIKSGKVPISSLSKLDGKIQLMKLITKKKSAQMNCTMNVHIQTRTLQDIMCM